MNKIFLNENWVVVDKPAGVLTTPSRYQDKDTRTCLGIELQTKLKKQIYPVHRLDFEVSGLVLFALNPKAHAIGNFWFENKRVIKRYEALSSGEPAADWQLGHTLNWQNKLLRGKRRSYESPHGKLSETEAVWQGWRQEKMFWHLFPKTGRPHQLRVHMAQNGFPIIGDELYGSEIEFKENEIALRACELNFLEKDLLGLPSTIKVDGF